jgi:hypothetical protein
MGLAMHACNQAACRLLKLMGFLICGIYLSACGGGSNDGGSHGEPVNVTGVWVGTYKADDGQSGTLLFDLVQDDVNLSGYAELAGVGIPYGRTSSLLNGTLVDLTASFSFWIGGQISRAQAFTNVTSNQLSGTVPLESGATASFTVSKLPTSYVTTNQDVLLTNESNEVPMFLTAWNSGLWIYEQAWFPKAASEILAYDGSGNLIGGIPDAPDCSGGFVRSGDGFFCSDYSGSLKQIRSSGTTWTSSAMPTGSIAMVAQASDGTSLWGLRTDKPVASGYTLLQQAAQDGTALGEGVQTPNMLSVLAFDDRGLLGMVYGLPVLVRIDSQTGKWLAAYKFADPDLRSSTGCLAWDGATLWTVVRFVSNRPPAPYPIYGQRLMSFSL